MCALAITGKIGSTSVQCPSPWEPSGGRDAVRSNSAQTGSAPAGQARPGLSFQLSLHPSFSERKQTDPSADGAFLANKPSLRLSHVQEEAEYYLSGSQHEVRERGTQVPAGASRSRCWREPCPAGPSCRLCCLPMCRSQRAAPSPQRYRQLMPASASTQSPGCARRQHAGTTEARKKASGRGRGGERSGRAGRREN